MMFDELEEEGGSFASIELDHVRQMFEEIRDSFTSADERLEALGADLDGLQRLVRELIDATR